MSKLSIRTLSVGGSAVALCLAGGGLASAHGYGSSHQPPMTGYGNARMVAGSGGVKFFHSGQTIRLGKVGHFTFTASCTKDDGGGNQVTFDVTADTTAALDGNAPMLAGNMVNIHTNSDALDMKDPGAFDQVGSASDSTQIAKDGQEVDIFYTDGVNWPALGGSQAHDCFAGYTGILG